MTTTSTRTRKTTAKTVAQHRENIASQNTLDGLVGALEGAAAAVRTPRKPAAKKATAPVVAAITAAVTNRYVVEDQGADQGDARYAVVDVQDDNCVVSNHKTKAAATRAAKTAQDARTAAPAAAAAPAKASTGVKEMAAKERAAAAPKTAAVKRVPARMMAIQGCSAVTKDGVQVCTEHKTYSSDPHCRNKECVHGIAKCDVHVLVKGGKVEVKSA